MDPLAVLDHALTVASVIKDQIVAFKNCPSTIRQAGEETLACATLLEEAKRNATLPKDKLLTAVKPIDSTLIEIKTDIERFKNTGNFVAFFKATSILETLDGHRKQLRNNFDLLRTIVLIKPHPTRMIPDEDARMFWVNNFGDLNSVNYSEFGVALSSRFPDAALGKYGQLLEKLLDLNGNGDVSILEFSKFILWFRPFSELPKNLEAVMQQVTFHFTPGFDFNAHLKNKSFCIKFSEGNLGGLSVYFKEDGVLKGRRIVDNIGMQDEEEKVLWEQNSLASIGKHKTLKSFLDAQSDVFGTKCCNQYAHKKTGGVIYDPGNKSEETVTAVVNETSKGTPAIPTNQTEKEPLKKTESSQDHTKKEGYTVLMKKNNDTDVYYMVESDMFLALYTDQKIYSSDPMSGDLLFITSFTLLKPVPRGISFSLAGDKFLILVPSEENGAALYLRIKSRLDGKNNLTSVRDSGLYSVS